VPLEKFCHNFHLLLEKKPERSELFTSGHQLLQELLSEAKWFGKVLCRLVSDPAFLEMQTPSVFSNEVTLYRSPDKTFAVLGYIWEPNSLGAIHDHSSWGLIGSLFHPMLEVKYRRLDEGKVEGYAELQKVSSGVLKAGEVQPILPLDAGIHQTGTAGNQWTFSLGIYGKSIRPGYIQFFHPWEKRVIRAYPPKVFKKVLALRALASSPEIWKGDISENSLLQSLPDYLAGEFQRSS